MKKPYVSITGVNVHLHYETVAPVVKVTTQGLSTGSYVHKIEVFSDGWAVAQFNVFSNLDAPLLVTQIDERPGAEASMVEQLEARA